MSLLSPDCRLIYIITPVWGEKKKKGIVSIIDQLLENIFSVQDASSITLVKAYLDNY